MQLIIPQLCNPIKESELPNYCNKPHLIGQKKLDGIRALLYFQNAQIRLFNRDMREITYRYISETTLLQQELVRHYGMECCAEGNFSLILDTEIISPKGYDIAHLRDSQESKTRIKILSRMYPVRFFLFDCLHFGKETLLNKPLRERLNYLKKIKESELIETAKCYDNPLELFEQVKKEGGEGIIIKDLNSVYEQGKRAWIKVKTILEKVIKVSGYQELCAGICCLANPHHRITCNRKKEAEEIKKAIDENKNVWIEINFLEENEKFRQPTYRNIVKITS